MEELERFDARLETRRFDTAENMLPADNPLAMDKWKQTTMDIVVPTREKNLAGNGKSFTFTKRLSPHSFDIFPSLVVNLLYEFELGILKSVLKHLIRILYVIDPYHVLVFNKRYVAPDLWKSTAN